MLFLYCLLLRGAGFLKSGCPVSSCSMFCLCMPDIALRTDGNLAS